MLRQAQEQAQKKGKVLIMHLCLLNFIFLRQGRFHCQIRTLALPLVSALLLALLVKTRLKICVIFQIRAKGGRLVTGEIKGLLKDQIDELKSTYGVDVVVNCTGMAAKELAGDDQVYPIRGTPYLF